VTGRSRVPRRRASAALAVFRHEPVRLDLFGHFGLELMLFEQVTESPEESGHGHIDSMLEMWAIMAKRPAIRAATH
jgi:hypothetical protein